MQVGDLVKTVEGWCSQQFIGMVIEIEPTTNRALVHMLNHFSNEKTYWYPIQMLEALCK